jgi:hypothetical protein
MFWRLLRRAVSGATAELGGDEEWQPAFEADGDEE